MGDLPDLVAQVVLSPIHNEGDGPEQQRTEEHDRAVHALIQLRRRWTSAVNVDRQGRRLGAVGEPDVEDTPFVLAVFHVGMSWWFQPFCLVRFGAGSLSALLLCPGSRSPNDSLLFLDGKNPISIRIGLGKAIQNHLMQSRFLRLGQLAVSILIGLRLQLEDLLLQRIACRHR